MLILCAYSLTCFLKPQPLKQPSSKVWEPSGEHEKKRKLICNVSYQHLRFKEKQRYVNKEAGAFSP